MIINPLIIDPKVLKLEAIQSSTKVISLTVTAYAKAVACPKCKNLTSRIHSRYERKVADLPWQGNIVEIKLKSRRFFCKQDNCSQTIFCERLPSVVAYYGRKSIRLMKALQHIGSVLGGEAGANTVKELGMELSADCLLSIIRRKPVSAYLTPRVLGIDDWAKRKGQRYGTILVDLETRTPIELLPDREPNTIIEWLRSHPGIEIITRDRATAYIDAINRGAPTAIQIADRWHLLKNLIDTFERVVRNNAKYIREATAVISNINRNVSASAIHAGPAMLSSRTQQQQNESRKNRLARYKDVMKLHKKGFSQRAIARILCTHRSLVKQFIASGGYPERSSTARGSRLDKFIPYIHQRWAEGCRNAAQIWREIVAQGYTATSRMVYRYIGQMKKKLANLPDKQHDLLLGTREIFRIPTCRRATWLLITKSDDLSENGKAFNDQLMKICPIIKKAHSLVEEFQTMVRAKESEKLVSWIDKAKSSSIPAFKGFAAGLERDFAAVMAALKYQWSNGQVEGQINRLKMLKRQMYGRANLDLLKARFL